MVLHDIFEGRAAAFFLAVQDHFDVLRRLPADCVHRCNECFDRAFVVAC